MWSSSVDSRVLFGNKAMSVLVSGPWTDIIRRGIAAAIAAKILLEDFCGNGSIPANAERLMNV